MFYRSGWLRCVGFICVVFWLCFELVLMFVLVRFQECIGLCVVWCSVIGLSWCSSFRAGVTLGVYVIIIHIHILLLLYIIILLYYYILLLYSPLLIYPYLSFLFFCSILPFLLLPFTSSSLLFLSHLFLFSSPLFPSFHSNPASVLLSSNPSFLLPPPNPHPNI